MSAPPVYKLEQLFGFQQDINRFVQQLFKNLDCNPNRLIPSGTKEPYDASDFTGWVLQYEDKERLKLDRDKIASIIFNDSPVFSICGNGYGTGLLVGLTLNEYYK